MFGHEYIAYVLSILTLGISFYFSRRSDKHTENEDLDKRIASVEARAKRDAQIDIQLQDIRATTTEIRDSIKDVKGDIKALSEKVVKVEESTKSAHKRIDTLEQTVQQIEKN